MIFKLELFKQDVKSQNALIKHVQYPPKLWKFTIVGNTFSSKVALF